MANALPLLLLGGAALLMMGGKKKVKPADEPEPADKPEPESKPEPEAEVEHEAEPWELEPGFEMDDRSVICFKETAGNVQKSMEIEDAILPTEGLWSTEIYKALKPEAQKELTGGSWISIKSQEALVMDLVHHINDLPLHLTPQGWGFTDEAFRKDVGPVIVASLLAPCQKISSRTTLNGDAPSPENLFMNSALKLARAMYIDAGVKTRGENF